MKVIKNRVSVVFLIIFLSINITLQAAEAVVFEDTVSLDSYLEIKPFDFSNRETAKRAEDIFTLGFGFRYKFEDTLLEEPHYFCYLAYYEKKVVGIMILYLRENKKLLLLNYLVVEPSFRNRGIGSRMLTFLKGSFVGYERIELKVFDQERSDFYKRNGFVFEREDPETSYFMIDQS